VHAYLQVAAFSQLFEHLVGLSYGERGLHCRLRGRELSPVSQSLEKFPLFVVLRRSLLLARLHKGGDAPCEDSLSQEHYPAEDEDQPPEVGEQYEDCRGEQDRSPPSPRR
jgi:hypothetical protein